MIAQTLAINHRDRVRSLTCISSTPSPDIGRMRPLTMLRLLLANPVALTGRAPRDATEAGEWMQAFQPGRNFIGLLAVTPGALLGLILCAYNSRRRVRVTVAIPGGSQPVAM